MDPKQFSEFMRFQQQSQQQLTELLHALITQAIPSTAKTSDTVSKKIHNFSKDKFDPENTSVDNFIELFEAKCKIYGKEYTDIQKDLFITCLPADVFYKIKTSFLGAFEECSYEELKEKLYSFYAKRTTRYKALTQFWSCTRKEDESMETYANKIKELSKDCGYEGEL